MRVLDTLEMAQPKTKEMVAFLTRLGVETTVLLLLPEALTNVELSGRNLGHVKTLRANSLNVRDLLMYDYVIMPRGSVDMIHGMLGSGD